MLSLLIPFIVSILLIWLPGLIIISGVFRKGDLVAYAASPFISVFLYSIIGEIFTRVGVFCSWVSVGVTALLVAVVLALIFKTAHHLLESRRTGKHEKANNIVTPKTTKRDCLIFALYPFMGTILVFAIYFGSLYSPDSVAALFDNMHHVDTIQGFIDSGQWKFLDVDSKYSSFATPQDVLHADWQDVWHSPQPPCFAVSFRFALLSVCTCFITTSSSLNFI